MSAVYGLRCSRAASSLGAIAFLVLFWIFQDWATFIHGYKGSLITPWDPGVGVVFAEFVTRPGELGVPVILMTAAIVASVYTMAAVIARRYVMLNVKLERLHDSIILTTAGMVGAIVVAILLSLLFLTFGLFNVDDLFPSIAREFVGDTIGIAIMSPLILRFWYLRHEFKLERIKEILLEFVIYAIMIISGLWFVF